MAFVITNVLLGHTPIGNIDTVLNPAHPLGTIVKAKDPLYGEGEFIYLKGVASSLVGSAVVWDSTYLPTLTTTTTRGPVAVAMAATLLGQFGWYQLEGISVVKDTGATSGSACQGNATPGVVGVTIVAGQYIDGMVTKTADGTPSAGFALCALSRPCMNGR